MKYHTRYCRECGNSFLTTAKHNKNPICFDCSENKPASKALPPNQEEEVKNMASVNYKRKCDECGEYVLKDEIIWGYFRGICKECATTKTLTEKQTIYIPKFLLKESGIKLGDVLKLVKVNGGILIKKNESELDNNAGM